MYKEVAPDQLDMRWLRGGFPRAFLADDMDASPDLAPLLADTGLLHSLLGIAGEQDLLAHPKCGASWEGFALHEVIRQTGAGRDEAYFWALHSGAELDLLIVRNGRRLGFEAKLTRSPKVTPSMRSAQQALELDHIYVVCHGDGQVVPLADGISAVPLQSLASLNLQNAMRASVAEEGLPLHQPPEHDEEQVDAA